MKCPNCGEESLPETNCRKCGHKIPSSGMEVQYKNFGGSEMLDIRMPTQQALPGEDQKPLLPDADNKQFAQKTFWKKRPAMVVFVLAAIIVSVMAWYYLLTFFLKF